MKAAAKRKTDDVAPFPENMIRNGLTDFWNQQAKDRQEDPFNPDSEPKGTIHDLLPALDSLNVARSFNVVSKILQFKVPIKLVKKGGYVSREQMLEDLLPKLRNIHAERNKLTNITA